MKKIVMAMVTASMVLSAAAAAAQCPVGALQDEEFETRGECEAAVAQARNERRQTLDPASKSAGMNEYIRQTYSCEYDGASWRVVRN